MKVYILVAQDKEGKSTFDMPVTFGRNLRVYDSKSRAKVYGRRFGCKVIELNIEEGKEV